MPVDAPAVNPTKYAIPSGNASRRYASRLYVCTRIGAVTNRVKASPIAFVSIDRFTPDARVPRRI
jgi:hypothetical protein